MSAKTNQLRKRLRIESERTASRDLKVEAKAKADGMVWRAQRDLADAREDFLRKIGMIYPREFMHRTNAKWYDQMPSIANERRIRLEMPSFTMVQRVYRPAEGNKTLVRYVVEQFMYSLAHEMPVVIEKMVAQLMETR